MWYLIVGFLALLYLLLSIFIPSLGTIGTYVIGPTLWILLTLLTILCAQKDGLSILKFNRVRRWALGNSPVHAGLLLGGFQIAVLILVGVFVGFGTSPYSFTPISLILNIFFVSTYLLGTEVSRAYLLRKGDHSRRYSTLFFVLTTLFFVVIQITPNQLRMLQSSDTSALFEFTGYILITSIAINLLASYLAYIGGATASISYMGILLVFQWFSPILPNTHWTILSLIGTIIPTIGIFLLQGSNREPTERKKRFHRKKANEQAWAAVAVFSVVMIFFSFGFLGVKPTVVSSGSMSPALEVGDLAIIQKVDTATVKTGDIIQFYKDNATILHRVIRIDINEGRNQYVTKGDANKDPDIAPVPATDILGKSIFTIPKLGWIQIFIKNILRSLGLLPE